MPPNEIKKVEEGVWEIPTTFKKGMLVPARIFASDHLLSQMDEGVFNQVTNVACLPGIQKYSYCMPDGHWGYGFPIGGVAAFDMEHGIISPGGVGFDINCGMRLLTTNLNVEQVTPKIHELVNTLYSMIPVGVGCKGFLRLKEKQFNDIMVKGARWCIENGYGWDDDKNNMEGGGLIEGADPDKVSEHALERGIKQLGTLGSGNHYLEIQVAADENIFDKEIASRWGIHGGGQIVVMFHCGSRGFGHQIGTDYLRKFSQAMHKYDISVADRELACAPVKSKEGRDYYAAMACAANMAFANRQVILHRIREAFEQVFGKSAEQMDMHMIYDVAHNIAKVEEYEIGGVRKKVMVHRKGATRALGPGNPDLNERYRPYGQPVILGGSMETGSYLLVGTKEAEEKTFGSTAHGSGRTMSRHEAKRQVRGDQLQADMERRGIYVRTSSMSGLAEEAGIAYKNINEVVESLELTGISKKVVAFKPIGNIKG